MKKITEMKFYIVDDMKTIRLFVKKHLRDIGVTNFLEFPDAQDAWNLMLKDQDSPEQQVEFIISDWNMPKMKGGDFLKKCRESEVYQNIPFLMLTAEAEISMIKDALSNDVDAYVVKPFTPETLKKGLAAAYRKRILKK